MRPACRAAWPASTALRIAIAISAGSAARETALASSTASQPSSIAWAASEAVPSPASQITGTDAALDDDPQVVGIADPGAGADRRAERHHRGAPGRLEPRREDRIVVRIRQHREAVTDQLLGGGEKLRGIGEQGAVVADHLELHPIGLERLARELGGADGVPGRVAAGRVRQAEEPEPLDQVDQRPLSRGVDAAQGDGDDLGPRRLERRLHLG